MALGAAHEGYDYQDLLAAYFILQEVIKDRNSIIRIDSKEFDGDKFDDLTITNSQGQFKKQIKYSNSENNHTLSKEDLSSAKYDLALDVLFESWKLNPNIQEVRLCLSWNEPTDIELTEVLDLVTAEQSIKGHPTKCYRVNADSLWPLNGDIRQSWKRFKGKAKSIDRSEFAKFTEQLLIEIELPKFSQNVNNPGELEKIVINQLIELGIGESPNDHLTAESTILHLTHKIRYCRSKGDLLYSNQVLNSLGVTTNYGAIHQVFPIDESVNVVATEEMKTILCNILANRKSILVAEPGAGKSWFVTNIQNIAREQNIPVIRHYCYTDLQDQFTTERITLKAFFGNLIGEILKEFPELREYKTQRYASNLTELNLLLDNIPEKTIIFLDGLDHISRIYELNGRGLSQSEIDIIAHINSLRISEKVSLVISSQPLQEVRLSEGIYPIVLPVWNSSRTIELMSKYDLKDFNFENETLLSQLLLEKSKGNSLYLTYLIKELAKEKNITQTLLESLPPYSNNLKLYYEYLLLKLPPHAEIPRLLSGCSFRVNNDDLKQITPIGDLVDQQIEAIKPILKNNISQGGYIIYHESFRRFMIEKLKEQNVEVKEAIYKPIINWLGKKNFFEFQKAYRFLFPMAYDYGDYSIISSFINESFLYQSVYYGNSMESINRNYHYMALATTKTKSFPNLITISELNKTLKTTFNEFYEEFETYIEALGYVHGFQRIAEYLIFEGNITIDDQLGRCACYISSINGVTPPWDQYMDSFELDEDTPSNELKYFIRYCIDVEDFETIVEIGEEIVKYDLKRLIKAFLEELEEVKIDEDISSIYQKVWNSTKEEKEIDVIPIVQDFLAKVDRHLSDKHKANLQTIIKQIRFLAEQGKTESLRTLQGLFNQDIWFHYWVQFLIEIQLYKNKLSSMELTSIFELLRKNTDPLKGNPQATWLLDLHSVIHSSITTGLKLLQNKEDWAKTVEILSEVSTKTMTYLQGSHTGPFNTDAFFHKISKHVPDYALTDVIAELTSVLEKVEDYHFHASLANNHFVLAKLQMRNSNPDAAISHFKRGIDFLFGYTMRKDPTLEELTESIISISKLEQINPIEEIKNLKSLVDSVVAHTDGKGTRHFPEIWFSRFFTLSLDKAILYLANSLVDLKFNGTYETYLQDLLIHLNGKYPDLEFLISSTFITETNEDFIKYRLELSEKISPGLSSFSNSELHHLHEIFKSKEGGNNDEIIRLISKKIGIEIPEEILKKPIQNKKYPEPFNWQWYFNRKYSFRRPLDEMSDSEILDYLEVSGISIGEPTSFFYYFDSKTELDETTREQVKSLLSPKNNFISSKIEEFFHENSPLYPLFWTTKFVTEKGIGRSSDNHGYFQRSYSINKESTIELFFDSAFEMLTGEYPQHLLSCTVINTLVSVDYEKDVLYATWSSLKESISKRIPNENKENWEEVLSNQFDLNEEELLTTILISRLNNASTERYLRCLTGLKFLFDTLPDFMLKPLKWFFSNSNKFLNLSYQSILQLMDESASNKLFDDGDLKQIILFNNKIQSYCCDYIIQTYYDDICSIIENREPEELVIGKSEYDFFVQMHFKYYFIRKSGVSITQAMNQSVKVLRKNRREDMELFYNERHGRIASNVYFNEYFNNCFNDILYTQFLTNTFLDESGFYYEAMKLNLDFAISYKKSLVSRPMLDNPYEMEEGLSTVDPLHEDWIRIAIYESQYKYKGYREGNTHTELFGAISFNSPKTNIPYSDIQILPEYMYTNQVLAKLEPEIISSLIQPYESLENFNFLWLDSNLMLMLKLIAPLPYEKLEAKDQNNETVLKFEHWKSDYPSIHLGNLEEEISQFTGGHLLIRADYYEKIKDILKVKGTPMFYQYVRSTEI